MQFWSVGDQNFAGCIHFEHENVRGTERAMPINRTPEEVYRIALSYERGYKYAKPYRSATGGATTSGTTGGAGIFQIKTESVGKIQGGYRNNRQRGRGSFKGRADMRRGASKRCAIIVINPILLRYISLDAQPKMRHVISAERRGITGKLVGENGLTGEDLRWD